MLPMVPRVVVLLAGWLLLIGSWDMRNSFRKMFVRFKVNGMWGWLGSSSEREVEKESAISIVKFLLQGCKYCYWCNDFSNYIRYWFSLPRRERIAGNMIWSPFLHLFNTLYCIYLGYKLRIMAVDFPPYWVTFLKGIYTFHWNFANSFIVATLLAAAVWEVLQKEYIVINLQL